MKKAVLVAMAAMALGCVALGDEITFSFIELNAPVVNITSGPGGMTAGPALNITVSDTVKHLEFPLTGTFNASTGPGVVTVTPDAYDATFTAGGSVSIAAGGTTFVAGMPMLDKSHLVNHTAEDVGGFAGEFVVTAVDPATLALFGLGPEWKPDGSVSITFGQSHVDGENLTGIIGGGTVTVETPAAVPEASTMAMFLLGLGSLWAAWQVRQSQKL